MRIVCVGRSTVSLRTQELAVLDYLGVTNQSHIPKYCNYSSSWEIRFSRKQPPKVVYTLSLGFFERRRDGPVRPRKTLRQQIAGTDVWRTFNDPAIHMLSPKSSPSDQPPDEFEFFHQKSKSITESITLSSSPRFVSGGQARFWASASFGRSLRSQTRCQWGLLCLGGLSLVKNPGPVNGSHVNDGWNNHGYLWMMVLQGGQAISWANTNMAMAQN
jgi:hypothetical protein